MRRALLIGCLLVSAGCAYVEPPAAPIPALPLPPPAVVDEGPAPTIAAEEQVRLFDSEPPWPTEPTAQVVTKANRRATLSPAAQGFDRGMLVYPYRPYGVYLSDVSCEGSLHIQLQKGEAIRLVAGLQPEDWIVQREDAPTSLESSHLTVTPHRPDVHGRLTLVTALAGEERIYYLKLKSHATHGLYGISWRHPPKVTR